MLCCLSVSNLRICNYIAEPKEALREPLSSLDNATVPCIAQVMESVATRQLWTVRVHPTPPRARQKGGPRGRPVRRPCPWTQSSPPASSHLASWSSPPSYRSVIAGLLRASPSAKSHGPPPPLAVKKAQSWPCAAVEEAADSSPAGNALQGAPHAGLLRVSRSDIRMQAPFPILPVQPWTAASPLYPPANTTTHLS